MRLGKDRIHVTFRWLILENLVLSKKTTRYFDPHHPFSCLIVFATQRASHAWAFVILDHVDPREFVLPGWVEPALSMLHFLCRWHDSIVLFVAITRMCAGLAGTR